MDSLRLCYTLVGERLVVQLPAMSIPGVGIDLVATTCGQRASAGPDRRVVASGREAASIWVVASIR